MKAPVVKGFRDKYSKKVYESGYYEGTEERVRELQNLGHLGAEKEEPSLLDGNVAKVVENVTNDLTEEELMVLLEKEQAGDNRKGVTKHIEGLLSK